MPVTLHLTAPKWTGGQYNNKAESWVEIASLFPQGCITPQAHEVDPDSEGQWLDYLHKRGIDAEMYWYADNPGEREKPTSLDISAYMKAIPLLAAEAQDMPLQAKSITVQWDSNSQGRTITEKDRKRVLARYQEEGYTPVVVGGQATHKHMAHSLKHIAYAMSKASLHVGVDSAFMHMAMLYLPIDRIHLYAKTDGYISHHGKRWRDMGISVNHH